MKKAATRLFTTTVLGFGLAVAAQMAHSETLRLLTWGGYAPDKVVSMFEKQYPDIKVEVTLSNNEEMIAKLRATGGAGFDLAQPSHDRIYAAELEYNIYKPLDLSKINTGNLTPNLLNAVKANTTIKGKVYAIPFVWGTSGLMADKTKAPDAKSWADLCNPKYKGRTSMRLKRTILLGTAFSMGYDPFKLYADKAKYQAMLNTVGEKLIACKPNVKAYWKGGDDLERLMLSGEVVLSETWDSTAYKLYKQNPHIVFVPPDTGALAWIDTFAMPRKGRADDAAYKWINFLMQPKIVTMIAGSSGAIPAVKGSMDMLPPANKAAVKAAFSQKDLDNLKFFANIPPGIEDMEGKTLDKIKAASN